MMDKFKILYRKFIDSNEKYINWEKIEKIDDSVLINYENLPDIKLINKVCMIKLNGGLGTSMGCMGPKSLLEVKDGMNFIDILIQQSKLNPEIPLVFMNSFYTHQQTVQYLNSIDTSGIKIFQFEQSCYPRILADNNEILDINSINKNNLYPPGHGDLLQSIYDSGVLNELLDKGIEYAMISNVDNLGAVMDYKILSDFIASNADFGLELTPKTLNDTKGGTLIKYDGKYKMFEVAQCPPEKLNEFTSIDKFKYFNTNNIWIKLSAIEKVIKSDYLKNVDLIINPKKLDDGRDCIQLEYAIGSMIKFFDHTRNYLVPRDRFIPVKRNDDLALVKSNSFVLNKYNWKLTKN